jgi:hypothetical protein
MSCYTMMVAKLTYAVGKDPIVASDRDWFVATALTNQAGTRICRAAELNTAHVQAYTPKRKAQLKRG